MAAPDEAYPVEQSPIAADILGVIGTNTLSELAGRVGADSLSRLKFIAAVVAIQESLRPDVLAPAPVLDLQCDAPGESAPEIELPAVRELETLPPVQPVTEPTQPQPEYSGKTSSVPSRPHARRTQIATASKRAAPVHVRPEAHLPEQAAAEDSDENVPNIKPSGLTELEKIFEYILLPEDIAALQNLSKHAREEFKETLASVYAQNNSGKRAIAAKQAGRVGYFMEGMSTDSIIHNELDTPAGIRECPVALNAVFSREPQPIKNIAVRLIETAQAKLDDQTTSGVPPASPAESTKGPEQWQDELLGLLEANWPAGALQSMRLLLGNKHPSETGLARTELSGLLYGYARLMPQGKTGAHGLTQTQWKTLSRLSGYGLKQGERILPIGDVRRMYGPSFKDRDRSDFDRGVLSAFGYLMRSAIADEDGPYSSVIVEATATIPQNTSSELSKVTVPLPTETAAAISTTALSTTVALTPTEVTQQPIQDESAESSAQTVTRPEKVRVIPQEQPDLQRDGYMSPTDIAAFAEVSVKEVRRTIDSLLREGKIKKGPVRSRRDGRSHHTNGKDSEIIINAISAD